MLAEHAWVSTPPGLNVVKDPGERTGLGRLRDLRRNEAVYPETERASLDAGFWWNAFSWPLVGWGKHAADFVSASGKPDTLKTLRQQVRVIAWEEPPEDSDALTVAQVAEHQHAEHRRGLVPAEVDVLTLTADVHDKFLYYIARGWRKETGSSWLIDAAHLGVHGPRKDEQLSKAEHAARIGAAIRLALEDLWALEQNGWPRATDPEEIIRASLCLIDGGYRPDAVGQFCLQRNAGLGVRRWRMVRGRSSRHKGAPRAIWDPQPHRSGRGHVFWQMNVDEGKHTLRDLLVVPRERPGAWHTYSDADLEAYHRHLVSEHFVKRKRGSGEVMVWEKREGAGPNHWWDCEVAQVAAAIACGVHLPTMPEVEKQDVKRKQSQLAGRRVRRAPIRRRY